MQGARGGNRSNPMSKITASLFEALPAVLLAAALMMPALAALG